MITFDEISPEFANLLKAAGWNPVRQVATATWCEILAKEGFVPNSRAVAVLESLGGLIVPIPPAGISPYDHELRFEPVRAATGEYDRAKEWSEELGTTLFPIGEETSSGNVIWVAGNGTLYYGRAFGLYKLGESLRTAMDQLAFPLSLPTLCVE